MLNSTERRGFSTCYPRFVVYLVLMSRKSDEVRIKDPQARVLVKPKSRINIGIYKRLVDLALLSAL